MDLRLTPDQLALVDLFGKAFRAESTPTRVRQAEPLGWDPELWQVVVGTGAPTMGIAESIGGGGASTTDLAVVAVEAGRHLASVPLIEVLAATHLLAQTDLAGGLVAAIGEGALLPTLSLRPPVHGTLPMVPAGAVADVVVYPDGADLIALQRTGPRPHQAAATNVGAAPLADVNIADDAVRRRVVATGADAVRSYREATLLWQLLTAAALVGLQQQALKIGVDYVKVREAFGVQLGWFQSVQHRLADVCTAGEGAELLMYKAAWAWDIEGDRRDELTLMAFLFAAEAAYETCRASMQFHGGYGFTLEYDIQLYFRRAKAWPLVIGPTRDIYRRLACARYGGGAAVGAA